MIKIAMVEDDGDLAQVLTQYLVNFNIEVHNFEDPYIGLSALALDKYDLIILDLTLPGLDGLELCKEIVKNYDIPIIISSARSDITDKVTALELGAEDYLPKPYDPRELAVRIKTILRRYNKHLKMLETYSQEIFKLDSEKKEITKSEKPIHFTAGEFKIMSLLIQKKGFIISRQDIVEENNMSQEIDENSGSIAVIINRIRHKIEENPKKPQHLVTVRGMGYKLVE